MPKTITRNEDFFRCRGSSTPALEPSAVIASSKKRSRVERKVPLFIPAEEVYYWSSAWQQGVAESMRALSDGNFEVFDSDDPTDVARWLLTVDEDDCD